MAANDKVKQIGVKFVVEGDTRALASLAALERAETNRLKLQAQLDGSYAKMRAQERLLISTIDAEIRAKRNLTQVNSGLANGLQAVNDNSGRTRAGLQNLSFQAQDFAVQVGGGTSALRAFGQQFPQAISAVQSMFSTTSKLGTFLTGPWGIALTTALAVLAPFAAKLLDTDKAAKDAKSGLEGLIEATNEYGRVLAEGRFDAAATDQARLAILTEERAAAQKKLNSAFGEEVRIQNELNAASRIVDPDTRPSRRLRPQEVSGARATADRIRDEKLLEKAQEKRIEAQTELARLDNRIASTNRSIAESARAASEATNQARKAWTEYVETLNAGGSELAALNKQERDLQLALSLNVLTTKGRAEAERQLTEIYEKRLAVERANAGAEGEIASQYIEHVKAQKLLNEKLAIYLRLADNLNNPELARWASEQAEAIRKQLIPAYDQALAAIDAMGEAQKAAKKKFDETVAEYNAGGRGGPEAGRIQAQIDELERLMKSGRLNAEAMEYTRKKVSDLQTEYDKLNLTMLQSAGLEVAQFAIDEIGSGIADAIAGTKAWGDAMEQTGRQITAMLTQIAVKYAIISALQAIFPGSNLIAGLKLAKGGVIDNGSLVTRYATGGVVTKPTVFPMAKGMGLMGEAGPEAIMPLKRAANGRLGVEASGGGSPVVNINNYAPATNVTAEMRDGILEIEVRAAERARALIASDIYRGDGSTARAIQDTYNLSRRRG